MLGRVRKTSGLDVGLALTFAGLAYLVWALVAGVTRALVQQAIYVTADKSESLPAAAKFVQVLFVDGGFAIDMVGLAWLVVSMYLILRSAHQRISISWAWMSSVLQGFLASLGGIWVLWANSAAFAQPTSTIGQSPTTLGRVSQISLPVILTLAVLIWVTFLVWLLVRRTQWARRGLGPSLSDSLRTHSYK